MDSSAVISSAENQLTLMELFTSEAGQWDMPLGIYASLPPAKC